MLEEKVSLPLKNQPHNPMFEIKITGPNKQFLSLPISENDLREIIRDSIYKGVRASQKIEGESLGPYDPPPIETVPENLLRTP